LKQPNLSIVIPAYQEEQRLGGTLEQLSAFLLDDTFMRTKNTEVIVVAATAGDKTVSVAKSYRAKFKHLKVAMPGKRVGKGRDVRYGMLLANGRKVMFMDADMATPLRHIRDFYKICGTGADIVVGTRPRHQHHTNLMRRSVSDVGNLLFRLLGGVWIDDSQCGFKMFTQQASQMCFSRLTILGWGFDMEVLTIAKSSGLKVGARRIEDWQDVPGGSFRDGVLQNSLRSLWDLAKIMVNRKRGAYKP
jgi:dolichyl-phosphate beta-glucosyltransferase